MKIIFLICLIEMVQCTGFASSSSDSAAFSLDGVTRTKTDTDVLVIGQRATGKSRADADSEGVIQGYEVEVSESDSVSYSYGAVDSNDVAVIRSYTETEGNGEDAIAEADAKERVVATDGINIFSLAGSDASSFSQSLNQVSITDAQTDIFALGKRASVNTTADAEAEATVGRDDNQIVVSESESESEGLASVFDGEAYVYTFTEIDPYGQAAFATADADAVADAAPLDANKISFFFNN